jgi:hypothetical protein
VYENKGNATKCTPSNSAFCRKMHRFRKKQTQFAGLSGRKCAEYEITRGEKLGTRDWGLGSRGWGWRLGQPRTINLIPNYEFRTRVPNPVSRIPNPASRSSCTPLYASNQKELAIYGENFPKLYVFENKSVTPFPARSSKKTRGGKYEGKSHYVVENTCRKNVRNRSRHYMYENKEHKGRSPLYL